MNRGYKVNHKRVQRLMHEAGLMGKRPAEKGTKNEHVIDIRYILMGICDRFPAMSGTYVLQQQIPADDYVYIFSDDDYIFDIAVYFSELIKEDDSYEILVKKSKAAAIRYEQMKQMMK